MKLTEVYEVNKKNNKLILGTAQFGMDYGVTNATGKISKDAAKRILHLARDSGITRLDTAPSYGDSQENLGTIGVEGFKITTKLPKFSIDSTKSLYTFLTNSVEKTLEDLQVNAVDTILLHDPEILTSRYSDEVYDFLVMLKKKKVVKNIGISSYEVQATLKIYKKYELDVIQAPYNVFDRRFANAFSSKEFGEAVQFQARSIFLQGILLTSTRSGYFDKWNKQFNNYYKVVKQSGLTSLEYCVRDALYNRAVDGILIGISSYSELKQILKATQSIQASVKDCPQIECEDKLLIDPRFWRL